MQQQAQRWRSWFRSVPPLDREAGLSVLRVALSAVLEAGADADLDDAEAAAVAARRDLLAMHNTLQVASVAIDRWLRHDPVGQSGHSGQSSSVPGEMRLSQNETKRVRKQRSPNEALHLVQRTILDAERLSDRLLSLPTSRLDDVVAVRRLVSSCVEGEPFLCPHDATDFTFDETERLNIAVPLRVGINTTEHDDTFNEFILGYSRLHWMLGALGRLEQQHATNGTIDLVVRAITRQSRTICRHMAESGSYLLARVHPPSGQHVSLNAVDFQKLAWRTHRSLRETLDRWVLSRQEFEASRMSDINDLIDASEPTNTPDAIVAAQALLVSASERLHAATTFGACPGHMPDRTTRRLRDEVWVLRFVLRAFADKVAGHTANDNGVDQLVHDDGFVDEFLAHYDVFATRVLKHVRYPRVAQLSADIAMLERHRRFSHTLKRVAAESERLASHLDGAFSEIDQSPELASVPFDERVPAEALRMYLVNLKRAFGGTSESGNHSVVPEPFEFPKSPTLQRKFAMSS